MKKVYSLASYLSIRMTDQRRMRSWNICISKNSRNCGDPIEQDFPQLKESSTLSDHSW